MQLTKFAVCLSLLSFLLVFPAQATPKVLVSIKPIHSLVAGVMEGVGEPELLLDGAASPHSYALKPSQARTLAKANIVFWMGHDLEKFLEKAISNIAQNARSVEFLESDAVNKLPLRDLHEGDHDAQHEEHDHDHGHEGNDPHVWLDPVNAKRMVTEITTQLSAIDPENAGIYKANALKLEKELDALIIEIDEMLMPYRTQGFIVFHDAYQYFENRFHLSIAGAISLSGEHQPGLDHIQKLQKQIKDTGAKCILSEPQFQPKLVGELSKRNNLKVGEIDPLGASLSAGADLYPVLIRDMARSIKNCLS